MANTSDDLISAETALVMSLMNLGEAMTNVATYRAHCDRLDGRLSAEVYREHAAAEIAKVRAALDRAEAVLVSMTPKAKAA